MTEDGDEDGFYLVKKGEDNIDVSDYFYFDDDNNRIESSSETYKETDTTETTKGKFEESSWGSFGFYLPWDGEEYPIDLYVDGTISYAHEYTYVYDTNVDEFTTDVDDLTSISIVNTVGEIEENGNFFALVTGSVNVAKGTAIDIVF